VWVRTLVLVTCLVAACSERAATQRRRDPGALVVAQAAGPRKLDPVRVTDNESLGVGHLLFEGLVRWKPGTTDVEPGLATTWRVSPDGKRWTFELRAGVTFHDGTPFDAAAAVFAFERLLVPAHPQYLVEDGSYWRALFKTVTKVRALAPLTVEIEVARPYAPLLGNLAMYPMVSPAAVRRHGNEFKDHPVGTGPFQLQTWIPDERVVVRRFDAYWGERARLEQIVFRVVVDPRQRLVELESGSVDIATSILPDEQPFIELHPDLVLHHTAGNDVSYLAFNLARPGFRDARVRRAVAHAINKEPLVKLAYQGRALAADGPLPPTQWGYHVPRTRYGFDPARARSLLDEAIAEGAFDPDAVYSLYVLSTPRPYLAQPSASRATSRPRSTCSASAPSS
jgi:peptide/nickel transport system substrate-binding protein